MQILKVILLKQQHIFEIGPILYNKSHNYVIYVNTKQTKGPNKNPSTPCDLAVLLY